MQVGGGEGSIMDGLVTQVCSHTKQRKGVFFLAQRDDLGLSLGVLFEDKGY